MDSPSSITNSQPTGINLPGHGLRALAFGNNGSHNAGDFDSILTKQQGGITSGGASDTESKKSRIRHSAQQLVAIALIKPMLNEARDSPLDPKLIDGGQGEKAFGKKLDNIMADRIVQGSNFPIVNAISDRLTQRYAQTDKHNGTEKPNFDLAG